MKPNPDEVCEDEAARPPTLSCSSTRSPQLLTDGKGGVANVPAAQPTDHLDQRYAHRERHHPLPNGGPQHPPVIALHVLMGSGACWAPLARVLEDEYTVLMPEARGHGRSSASTHGYLYPDHANDVLGLIGALKLTRPVLLGHFMGGMTAALTRIFKAPYWSTRRASVPSGNAKVYGSDVAEQHRHALNLDKSELAAQAKRRRPSRSTEVSERLVEAGLQTRMQAFEVLAPLNPEYRELIQSVRVPILLILGSSGTVTLNQAQELQTLDRGPRYEGIPTLATVCHTICPSRLREPSRPSSGPSQHSNLP
nr:alpha/beta hydrolase [Deinococcus hopiensis]